MSELKPFDITSMDAVVWAKEFMRLYPTYKEVDEGLMIGWFANAIMAGYDEANRRHERTPSLEKLDEDEVAFEIFNCLRVAPKNQRKLAREEWTAKHFISSAKNQASEIAKAICSKFGQPAKAREQEYIKENCKCYTDGTGAHYISKGCYKHNKHFTAKEVDEEKLKNISYRNIDGYFTYVDDNCATAIATAIKEGKVWK